MAVTRFPQRGDGIADRMSGFIAHLRMNGLKLGPADTRDALAAMGFINALDPETVRLALRSLLAVDSDSWRRFDGLFDAYWFNAGRTRTKASSPHVRVQLAQPRLWQGHLDARDDTGPAADQDGESTPDSGAQDAEGMDGRLIATRTENLRKRDLRELMDERSLREAERAARDLARAIRDKRSRRRRQARRGALIDLRRTLRASLARGGEPVDLFRRTRPDRPMHLVVLCDVSGSMQVYSRVFLAFVKGLVDADTSTDAYLFHTRLMRVTDALGDHDTLRAAGRLSLMAQGFGGGTDIAASLTEFADAHAARALGSRSVVIILSDGYCTGEPARLAEVLARIRRKARRIVWLNPLLGWKDYEPVAAAMAAALPHLDAHLPANTIEALAALETEFARL